MLRSILIGLDGSDYSHTALRLGIDWARHSDALLVGLGIVDAPTIRKAETVLIGGTPHADPYLARGRLADARREVEQFLEQFALECAEAGVAAKVLEDVRLPADEIVLKAQRYDVVLLGQETRFHFETDEHRDDTLPRVLKNSPRPVVTAPGCSVGEGRCSWPTTAASKRRAPRPSSGQWDWQRWAWSRSRS
jgi:nucleotide-binding universal stress UspA family protein